MFTSSGNVARSGRQRYEEQLRQMVLSEVTVNECIDALAKSVGQVAYDAHVVGKVQQYLLQAMEVELEVANVSGYRNGMSDEVMNEYIREGVLDAGFMHMRQGISHTAGMESSHDRLERIKRNAIETAEQLIPAVLAVEARWKAESWRQENPRLHSNSGLTHLHDPVHRRMPILDRPPPSITRGENQIGGYRTYSPQVLMRSETVQPRTGTIGVGRAPQSSVVRRDSTEEDDLADLAMAHLAVSTRKRDSTANEVAEHFRRYMDTI
nr:hypothetical protein [Sicyoidochytrium minutum DNA virus]